jgi:pimeloyl-ACP methyl ester carboxylesterase
MKTLTRLLGLGIIAYLFAAGWLYLNQRDILFVRDGDRKPMEGFWLQVEPNTRIWIDQLNPGKSKALIYFPGNTTSDWEHPERLAKMLPDHTIYFSRHRGYANSEGAPSQKALYADALRLHDRTAKEHTTVNVMGRSLGSAMASYVASHRSVHRLILTTPFGGIALLAQREYPWLPISLILKDPFPSTHFAPAITEKTLILLAEADTKIPLLSSQTLINAFDTNNKPETIMLRGANHVNIVHHPLYLKSIVDFLNK